MTLSNRDFLALGGVSAGAIAAGAWSTAAYSAPAAELSSITGDAVPITVNERLARIAKAQRLMAANNIDAILLEPGSAMLYFSGVSWWRSERLTAVIIPREGGIGIVTPFFEEPSVRESMTFGDDVRPWNEHDSPFERVAGFLKDRGLTGGRIGLEETVRYFVVDGLQKAAPSFEITSATQVTQGCRMYKSAAEIALMKKATEVTLTAYRHVYKNLEVGMEPRDVKALMSAAQTQLGGVGSWNMALLGVASA